MIKKILIISDSHGSSTWLNFFNFNDYDHIIHAGDHLMSTRQISSITPYYVDGNNDWGHQHLLKFKINEINFILTHGDEYLDYHYNYDKWYEKLYNLAKNNESNVVIFGHTHIPIIKIINNVTLINPGSVSFSRHNGKKWYMELEIDNHEIISINAHEI